MKLDSQITDLESLVEWLKSMPLEERLAFIDRFNKASLEEIREAVRKNKEATHAK